MIWWNTAYPLRRQIKITPPEDGVLAGHPIEIPVSAEWLISNKVREDGENLEVAYQEEDGSWLVLDRLFTPTKVTFLLPFDLEAESTSYYLYYASASIPLPHVTPIIPSWPVIAGLESHNLTFTRPGDHWEDGISDVEDAWANFRFNGVKVRLISEVGPEGGIAEVYLDAEASVEVDLFDLTTAVKPVWEALDLTPGPHEVRVRVSGRKDESSVGYNINVQSFEYSKAIGVEDLGEQFDDRVWSSVLGGS